MDELEKFRLKDKESFPTSEYLEPILNESYEAYVSLQESLPRLDMEQNWQWYTPYKAWLAKGQHFWTSARGTRKEKNLYWLHIYDDYFCVVVWFKESSREKILTSLVSEKTKRLIMDAETLGKVPTFPVVIEVTGIESLDDVYILLQCKKELEK